MVNNKEISKQQMAYEKIKEAIITEKYKTDQFLSSRELCADLGISRTPVMEALRRLAYEGFVEAVLIRVCLFHGRFEDFIELYEIRLGMESIAPGYARPGKLMTILSRWKIFCSIMKKS